MIKYYASLDGFATVTEGAELQERGKVFRAQFSDNQLLTPFSFLCSDN